MRGARNKCEVSQGISSEKQLVLVFQWARLVAWDLGRVEMGSIERVEIPDRDEASIGHLQYSMLFADA